jgi:hypothetical protein
MRAGARGRDGNLARGAEDPGHVSGTRELVIPDTTYIVPYRA